MQRRTFNRLIYTFVLGSLVTPLVHYNLKAPNLSKSNLEIFYSLNLDKIENIIMINTLLLDKTPQELIEFHANVIKDAALDDDVKQIKEKLISKSLKKIDKSSSSNQSYNKHVAIMNEFDSIYSNINSLKRNYNLYDNLNENELEKDLPFFKNLLLEDFNLQKIKNYFENIRKKVELKELKGQKLNYKDKYDWRLYGLFKTLIRISPDALFIKETSIKSGIPLEEIIALIHIESSGREFVVSNKGEINRLQLNSKYLNDIYNNSTSENNSMTTYIKENTTPETVLYDLVSNSKLNIAVGINFFNYLKKNTDTEYKAIVAYNSGIEGSKRLSKRTKYKLTNPDKISEDDLDNNIIRYYHNFLDAKSKFQHMREIAYEITKIS